MRFAPAALAAALLLAPAAPVRSQDAPTFTSGLEMVNLTLSVRDAEGHLVNDLQPGEFEVIEDSRPQNVQLFARAVEPVGSAGREESLALDLGLLLDTSESMMNELRLSQEAAVRFLEAIPRAHELLTVFFDQDIRVSRYDSEHQQGLVERIMDMKGSGHTALYDAITVYLSRVADSPGRKILVLFTDGEDTTSSISLPQLIGLVRGSHVTIYPIAFTGSFTIGNNRSLSARSFVERLADISGGQVFLPRNSKDLPGIYDKILEELQSQYVIGFVSDNPAKDGRFRKLEVRVRRPGLRVRARQGYTVPKE
jgi:Ca-activated chloride channel family protein